MILSFVLNGIPPTFSDEHRKARIKGNKWLGALERNSIL
jgi:hypothetical protein